MDISFGEGEVESDSLQSYLLRISHMYFTKSFSQVAEYGIHPGQISLLRLLGLRGDGLSQNEICRSLKIKPSTAAVSLKRLEKAGLIERRQDEKDQRVVRVYTTEKARRLGQDVIQRQLENEEIMLRGFSEAEICLLKRFLRQILENTERLPAKAPAQNFME